MNTRIPEPEIMLKPCEVKEFDTFCRRYLIKGYRLVTELLKKNAVTKGTLLDVGTGSGWLALTIAQELPKCSIVGIDLSEKMLEYAKINAAQNNNVRFEKCDAAALHYQPESFDAAVSFASLHHWDNPIKVIDNMYSATKKNGYIIIADLKRDNRSLLFNTTIRSASFRMLFENSVNASYTMQELQNMLTIFKNIDIIEDAMFVSIVIKC